MLPMFTAEYMKNYRSTSLEFYRLIGRNMGYLINPSRSQSSPWAKSDMWKTWHPFDALLAERRAVLKGERDAIAAAASKDAAWWDERRRG